MSFPFYDEKFTFTQPDGTKLEVKGWGDQHQAVFETMDGHTVVKDPVSGYYQYADVRYAELVPSGILPGNKNISLVNIPKGLRNNQEVVRSNVFSGIGMPPGNSRWKQRREEARQEVISRLLSNNIMPAPPQRQTIGTYVGLCLLIRFPDVAGTISVNEVEAFCNKNGYNGYGNNGSVYNYFLDNSLGKLKYTNIIAPYYTAKKNREYYTNEEVPQPVRTVELIQEALAHHKANGFDFTGLTSDQKNYVYALNVFYAGDVVNNWAEGLWPHSYHLNSPLMLVPGKLAYDYQITNMGSELTLATFCHENGHMICDFPDLYDYGNESRGVGTFCLMCAGGNASKKNPVQVGAYLKFKAGWTGRLSTITPGQVSKINAAGNEFCILRKNVTEYFIVENRKQSLRDSALRDSGLAIWHVDEFGNNSNEQMTATSHYECSLVQADGKHDLESGINDGDNTDLFRSPRFPTYGPGSHPQSKWWDGSALGLELFDISAAGDEMTFSVR